MQYHKPVSPSRNGQGRTGYGTIASRIDVLQKQGNIGPGQYDPKITKTKIGFSLGSRPALRQMITAPGPGQYTVQKKSESPQFSLRGRPTSAMQLKQTSPGPAAYLPPRPQSSQAYSFRGRTSPARKMETPAPGHYTGVINHGAVGRDQPEVRMHARVAKQPKSETPAPCSYTKQGTIGSSNSPKHSFSGRVNLVNKIDQTPGPGAYAVRFPGSIVSAQIATLNCCQMNDIASRFKAAFAK